MKLLEIDGKPVVDAKKSVTLHILPEDVQRGRKKAPDCCAAAQACMRQLGAKQARVHLSRVYVETPKRWLRFTTPRALRTEIISFDRGHRFEAGDYQLGAVPPSYKLGMDRHKSMGTHPKRGQPGVSVPARGKKGKYHAVKGVRYSASPSVYAA